MTTNMRYTESNCYKLFLDAWAGTNKYIMSIGSTAGLKTTATRSYDERSIRLDKERHTKLIHKWRTTKPNGPNLCNFNFGFYKKPDNEPKTALLGQDVSDYVSQLDRAEMHDFGDYIINLLNDRESIWIDEIYVDLPNQDNNRNRFIKDYGIA